MGGRTDRDQQSNKTADRAQSATGGRGTAGGGRSEGNEAVIGGKAVTVDVAPGGKVTTTPTGSPVGRNTTGSSPGGGTTTQDEYTPGAVGNFPDANAAAVADMLSSALPGMGLTNTAYKGAKAAMDGSDPLSANAMGPIGDMLGGDPGKQRGFQPDRYRGNASLGGIGGDGGAVNSGDDEREIAGQRFGAGTMALTGDSEAPIDGGDGSGVFSDDIMLRDRRKPRVGAGTQMLLGA